jgi:hypothetical protein
MSTLNETASRKTFLQLCEGLLQQGIISSTDLMRYVDRNPDKYDPENVRLELELWYKNLGIEAIIGRSLHLSECPFSKKEIEEAAAQNEVILCVPGAVSRADLGTLFRLDSWALHDRLVSKSIEKEDFWFKTSMSLSPGFLNMTGIEIKHKFLDEKKVLFSLERYLVFIGRVRFLLNQTPDQEYWIWLPHVPYDRSGMLMAGFDRFHTFNVHGWMPQFSASFNGARYGLLPEALQ